VPQKFNVRALHGDK